MIMMSSNIILDFSNFYVIVSSIIRYLFSAAVRAVALAKLVILGFFF